MRLRFVLPVCLTLLSSTLGAAAAEKTVSPDSLRKAAIRQGWPDTDTGMLGARWVRAFSKGEKAMKTLLKEILTPESLEKRSMDERLEGYRSMHERFGELQLVKVVKSSPSEVTVQLAGMDMIPREFTFFAVADQPGKLDHISYQDFVHPGHGGGGFHH
jgi:hypothetical protein